MLGWCIPPKSKLTKEQKIALVLSLADSNDNRGGDSWGYYVPDHTNPTINHGLGYLAHAPAYTLAKYPFIMCHTRKSTIGKTSIENAHPFEIGDIVGAQNGGVTNHIDLDKKYKRSCDVDSMHVFHHINENRSLEELRGYGAIEFTRKSNPDVICLVNVQGGLLNIWSIGSKEEPLGIVWSSDDKHLSKALKWAGINKFTSYQIEEGKVYLIERNKFFVTFAANCEMKFGTFSRSYTTYSCKDNEHFPTKWNGRSSYKEDDWQHGFIGGRGNDDVVKVVGFKKEDEKLEEVTEPFSIGTEPKLDEISKGSLKAKLLQYANDKDAFDKRDERDKELQTFIRGLIPNRIYSPADV